jgi:hypothetical protein
MRLSARLIPIVLALLAILGCGECGKKALMKKLLKGALLAQVLRPNFIPVPMPIPFPMQHQHQGWSPHQRMYPMPSMHQYYPPPMHL